MIDFKTVKKIVVNKLSQLNPDLTYHCLEHTLDVLQQSERIASEEGVKSANDLMLLKIASLYHDTGFLFTYGNHEAKGCEIFMEDAENFELTETDKNTITALIMATQIPQSPKTLLERILCDADLDYLGRDDFFTIGNNLKKEFIKYKIVADENEWEKLQLKFLNNHHYHTESSRTLREPGKRKNFAAII